MKWFSYETAEKIPGAWDQLAGKNVFLKKAFLQHLEVVNPCQQSYNYLKGDGTLQAIYVDYRLNLDMFTFNSYSLKIPVRIMGIPCSVSKQGFAAETGLENLLVQHFQNKQGAKIILNSSIPLPASMGETLPTLRLEVTWQTLEEYLHSLRSPYRYRLNKALKKWADVQVELIFPTNFQPEMYSQYEAVFHNSQAKLEKQNANFFKGIPLPSKIIKASYQGKLLGFVQLVENGEELIFLFTGFDYQLNRTYDIYLNLLLEIIRYGVLNNYKVIDFGQTTEATKMKLGCKMERKNMYLSHSNPIINFAAAKLVGLLSYKPPEHHFQVFK